MAEEEEEDALGGAKESFSMLSGITDGDEQSAMSKLSCTGCEDSVLSTRSVLPDVTSAGVHSN